MTTCRTFLSVLFLTIMWCQLQGQNNRLYIKASEKPASEFFYELSLQSGVNIIYSDFLIEKLPNVTLEMKGVSVDEVLTEILSGTPIAFKYISDQIVLYQAYAFPSKFTVSGLVSDSVSGEPLISAYIYDEISGKSTLTNEYGYFSLNLPAGEARLIFGYSGFLQHRQEVRLLQNKILQIRLIPNALLPAVIVHDRFRNENEFVPPAERISLADLQNSIQLGGSSDLYRAADFIPGVHTGTDGVGGIHVRGGANDQNLILMDGVPVYHPNHLLGIVSVFNHQAMQQASIYKANFPSKFSGRLSSVMDVRTREGNIHEWGFSGNVGVSEFGLMAEGPIVPGKIGILVTGRFFLPGLFMNDITRNIKERNNLEGFSDIDYVDFNGKLNWKIGLRDRVYLSTYRGHDKFTDFTITRRNEVDPETGIRIVSNESFDKNLNWENRTAVFRWNHIISEQVFSKLIFSTSSFVLQSVDKSKFNYFFPGSNRSQISGFDTKEFKSGIQDVTVKLELDIRPTTEHQINAGAYGIQYLFQPKSVSLNEESKVGDFYLEEGLLDDGLFEGFRIKAAEAGVYLEDKWSISEKVQISSGLHVSGFFVQNIYYLDPQLRLRFDFIPAPKLAFNVGYSRMVQYLHNLTSSSIGLPTDLWVPTTASVAPALSDQYSMSGAWIVAENVSLDLSAYLKTMRSLISYQEGASFLLREGPLAGSIVDAGNWESKVTTGRGDAYGVELQLIYEPKKLSLKWNGTWSRAYRLFETINNGLEFPDRYDRRWSSTLTAQYKLGQRWTAGVNFLYGSGIAITLAESKFYHPGAFFPVPGINYSARNGYRLPDYHRMDITLNYQLAEAKRFSHSLSLNLYNVYNRTNPFYITLVQDPIKQLFEYRQFSLFKFFPSVTYRFTFN